MLLEEPLERQRTQRSYSLQALWAHRMRTWQKRVSLLVL